MNQISSSTFLALLLITLTGVPKAAAGESRDLSAFTRPTKIYDVANGEQPRIAKGTNGTLHVVFQTNASPGKRRAVLYTQSKDSGQSWTTPVDISNSSGNTFHADIAVESEGSIDVVWCDNRSNEENPDVFFARSNDNGKTWSKSVDVSNTPGQSTEPAIAISTNDSIHVVWSDTSKGEKNQDIYYVSSSDHGKTWAKDPLLPADDISNTIGNSSQPAISVDSGGIPHVVWLDDTVGTTHPDIFYVRRENGSWTKPVDVSHSPRLSDHPSIGCGADGKIYVTWLDYSQKPTAPDIWCAICGKNGRFEKPINISNTPGVSGQPIVASDDTGRVVFVWTDTSKTFKKPDVFARISNDGANDFTRVMDISNTPGVSKHPHVVISGKTAFVIWEEMEANTSMLKIASLGLENLATGPAMEVDPTIRGKTGNSR